MKARYLLILSSGLCCVCLACEDEADRQKKVDQIIRQEVESRIGTFKMQAQKECEAQLMAQAKGIVDSLILEHARQAGTTKPRPPKPDRPERPPEKELQDTVPVQPLLRDTSRKPG